MCCCRHPPKNQMFQPAGNLSPSLPSRCFHRKTSEDLRVQIDWKISQAARKALCSSGTPITLLSDMFDLLTLESCEELFKTVEQEVILDSTSTNFPFHCIVQVSTWRETVFFTSFTKNNLLRICNDLLRRLSRTQNTVFCGRILLFLAKFFPFSERLQLNAQHF